MAPLLFLFILCGQARNAVAWTCVGGSGLEETVERSAAVFEFELIWAQYFRPQLIVFGMGGVASDWIIFLARVRRSWKGGVGPYAVFAAPQHSLCFVPPQATPLVAFSNPDDGIHLWSRCTVIEDASEPELDGLGEPDQTYVYQSWMTGGSMYRRVVDGDAGALRNLRPASQFQVIALNRGSSREILPNFSDGQTTLRDYPYRLQVVRIWLEGWEKRQGSPMIDWDGADVVKRAQAEMDLLWRRYTKERVAFPDRLDQLIGEVVWMWDGSRSVDLYWVQSAHERRAQGGPPMSATLRIGH